jgi:hypothetical protein
MLPVSIHCPRCGTFVHLEESQLDCWTDCPHCDFAFVARRDEASFEHAGSPSPKRFLTLCVMLLISISVLGGGFLVWKLVRMLLVPRGFPVKPFIWIVGLGASYLLGKLVIMLVMPRTRIWPYGHQDKMPPRVPDEPGPQLPSPPQRKQRSSSSTGRKGRPSRRS